MEQKTYLKNRIEQLLSEILSDKHGCKVVLKFEQSKENQNGNLRKGA